MKEKVRKKVYSMLLVLFILLPMFAPAVPLPQAYAAANYQISDQTTTTPITGGDLYISGNHMVWVAEDKQKNRQVYYKNLITGESKQVTDYPSLKQTPVVTETAAGQIIVIWTDKRNYDPKKNQWDLYAFYLSSGIEKRLNSKEGHFVSPSAQGETVVWHSPVTYEMFAYHLIKGEESYLGKGRYPVVSKEKVLFQNERDGGLSLYDLAAKESKEVLKLPYGQYADWYTFNGRYLLVLQKSTNREVVYRTVDVTDPALQVKNLTPVTKPESVYWNMAIGDSYAAWLESRNGTVQIIGADLANGSTFQISNGSNKTRIYNFNGDQLMVSGADGNLLYLSIARVDHSGVNETVGNDPLKPKSVEKWIGPEGGQVRIETGEVMLEIPKDAFKEKTLLSIQEDQSAVKNSEKNLKQGMRFISTAWKIHSGNPFAKKAKISFSYDKSKVIPQHVQKLGVYRYDPSAQTWKYIGGVTSSAGMVETNISDPGTYALLLNERSFADIKGHWAQQTIEILASRWLVDGTKEDQFSPNMRLTRAQFAKMLAAAMDLKPVHPSTPTFRDLSSSHWGYEWIEAAAEAGWVQGDRGEFRPDDVLTREQMMIMLIRALGEEGKQFALNDKEIKAALDFKDSDQISPWAESYVALAVSHGFIQGTNGKVLPLQSSTRAEAAAVIYRLLSHQKKL